MRVQFFVPLVLLLLGMTSPARADSISPDSSSGLAPAATRSEQTKNQQPGVLEQSLAPSSGCAVAGLLPGAVTAVGCVGSAMALDMIVGTEDGCVMVGGVVFGLLFGVIPMVVGVSAMGLMAPCGAMVGHAVGAGMRGQNWFYAALQASPGLAVGALGSALLLGSVLASPDIEDVIGGELASPLITTGIIVGGLLALAAGPVAIVSAVLLGGAAEKQANTQPVAAPAAKPGDPPVVVPPQAEATEAALKAAQSPAEQTPEAASPPSDEEEFVY